MYAVIKTGGKQYRVAAGDTIRVEKLNVSKDDTVELTDVLLVADGDAVSVGTPHLSGARVTATVKAHGRRPKVNIIKFKRRKHHRKQMGHRQAYTELTINDITPG